MTVFTPYHSQYLAHRLTLEGASDDAFAKSISTARVDLNPHQVDAALFALASPISKGVILADEVGLGKTIEASLVIAQSATTARTTNRTSALYLADQVRRDRVHTELGSQHARRPLEVGPAALTLSPRCTRDFQTARSCSVCRVDRDA